jgi:hypothetical protein
MAIDDAEKRNNFGKQLWVLGYMHHRLEKQQTPKESKYPDHNGKQNWVSPNILE